MKRVFHPTMNAWKDVPEGDVEKWVEGGWKKAKPKHVDDSDAHKPGDFHSAPVAVELTPEKAAKPSPTKTEEKPSK